MVLPAHNAIGLGLVSTARCLRGHLCSGQPQRELDLAKNIKLPPDLISTLQGPSGDIDLGIRSLKSPGAHQVEELASRKGGMCLGSRPGEWLGTGGVAPITKREQQQKEMKRNSRHVCLGFALLRVGVRWNGTESTFLTRTL